MCPQIRTLEHRAVHLVVLQQIVELALSVRAHGTELVQPEQLAVAAHPQLAEQDVYKRQVLPMIPSGGDINDIIME